MTTAVCVRTPCRLHFGMFGFGRADRAQFGGVGAMVEPPGVEVRLSPAGWFRSKGSLTARTQQVVELLAARWNLPTLPACEIDVRSPRDHTGLGVGTQLSLAIAVGLRRFLRLTDLSAEELAASAGRGARSAVGTHGFRHGGLIVDAGKSPGESLGKLAAHVALPDAWRFVLICPAGEQGLAGAGELTAFDRLPPVFEEVTRHLWAITIDEMLPAIEHQDCTRFGEAVYRFGRRAGECFSAVQGGSYASAEISRLVTSIREIGVSGVGQSSWGPTVFAIVASEEEAGRLVDWVQSRHHDAEYEVTIARPNNRGASIE